MFNVILADLDGDEDTTLSLNMRRYLNEYSAD
jgi:hypothetical protein